MDKCDLRCTYCLPKDFKGYEEPADWLTHAEMSRLIGLFVGLGVQKVRLTGESRGGDVVRISGTSSMGDWGVDLPIAAALLAGAPAIAIPSPISSVSARSVGPSRGRACRRVPVLIASSGGGQSYTTTDASSISRIFTQDTLVHTGRIRMFGASAPDLMRSYVESRIAASLPAWEGGVE